MVRVPLHNDKSARIELRSVGTDANTSLLIYSLIKTGLEGKTEEIDKEKRPRARFLPGDINTAINHFRQSDFVTLILGEEMKKKFIDLKQKTADRSPSDLGTRVKNSEVIYHHEVHNQMLWNDF
jgi:glutamine synthetase